MFVVIVTVCSLLLDIVHTEECGFADSAHSITGRYDGTTDLPFDIVGFRPSESGYTFDVSDAFSSSASTFLVVSISFLAQETPIQVSGIRLANPTSNIDGFRVAYDMEPFFGWSMEKLFGPTDIASGPPSGEASRVFIVFESDSIADESTNIEVIVPCTPECDTGWLLYDNHCYLFVKNTARWEDAITECEDIAASLLKIDTQAEIDWIRTQLLAGTNGLDGQSRYWTSGNKIDGTWYWASDGTPITVFDWGNKEPNNLKNREDCINLLDKRFYKYNDSYCRLKQGFICELSLN